MAIPYPIFLGTASKKIVMDTIWTLDRNKGISRIANFLEFFGGPNGSRTRVTDVRGRCPRPLDDGTDRVLDCESRIPDWAG